MKVEPEALADYRFSGRTFEYHRAQVREAFGFREAAVSDEEALAAWMAEEVCPVELREERLREALLARCRAQKIEPPAVSRVGRVVGSAKAAAEQTFCARTVARLPEGCTARLEELVTEEEVSDGSRSRDRSGVRSVAGPGMLAELKADPVRISLDTLLREVDKLGRVRAIGCPTTCSRAPRRGWSRPGA